MRLDYSAPKLRQLLGSPFDPWNDVSSVHSTHRELLLRGTNPAGGLSVPNLNKPNTKL